MNYILKNIDRTQIQTMSWIIHETDFHGLNTVIDELLTVFDRGPEGVFPKSDLDLLDLAPWLQKICLLDFVVADDRQLANVLVRFQGKDVSTFFGEHTHQSIENLAVPESIERVLQASRRVSELRHPLVCVSNGAMATGDTLHADILFVPLAAEDQGVVGTLVYFDLQILRD